MRAEVCVSNINFLNDKEFSYRIPDELIKKIDIGTKVIIPFGRGNRRREGVVTRICDDEYTMPLKSVLEVANEESFVTEENIELARYISDKSDIDLVSSVIFDRLYWDRLDDGSITDDEVKSEICKRLPENLHSHAVKIYDNWYYNLPVIDGIVELIRDIKSKGLKLYLLSNISINGL